MGDLELKSAGIKQNTVALVARATKYLIKDQSSYEKSAEILSTITSTKREAEKMRKSFTTPLNESLKNINTFFKDLTAPLDKATGIIKSKVQVYYEEKQRKEREATKKRLLEEAKREEALRIQREKEEAERKKAEEENREPVIVEPEPTFDPVEIPKVVAPEKTTGGMTVKSVWKWELEDIEKVERSNLILDTVKIGKLVRAGVRTIAGIRVYGDKQVSVR